MLLGLPISTRTDTLFPYTTRYRSTGRQLVALSQSTEEMGSARLVIFGPGGGILKATDVGIVAGVWPEGRSEEHTSELQSLMRISYAVFCLKKNKLDTIIG